jgi:predicted  nucleic acid-binding Zn-ribbon protein
MENNIKRLAKLADMRLQVQTIEGYCKAIIKTTDGTQEVSTSIVNTINDISTKMLEAVKKYYSIEDEIRHME